MAEARNADGVEDTRVDLAREPDFALGLLTVRPSLCEVVLQTPVARLQPRIMQVLVVLARADGAAVSRAELVERCWSGLVVGEDALNRCIARLRRLSEVEAPGSFVVETLPRVGYRLLRAAAASAGAPALASPDTPQDLSGVAPPAADRRLRLHPLAVAAASIVALGVLASAISLHQGAPVRSQRVALAPFASAGVDPTVRALASGVPDTVAAALISADFKPIALPPAAAAPPQGWGETARRLGGTLLLEGRVEAAPRGLLHASATLSSLPDHTVLWSGDFTRAASAAQAMKVQIAGKIADVLHCALDTDNFRDGRYDRQTFALFLSACDLIHDYNKRDRVGDVLRQVLVREPHFPRALAMLAIADALAVLPPEQAQAAHRESRALAVAALKADPDEGAAYNALHDLEPASGGYIRPFQWLQKGLAVSPNEAGLNDRMASLLMRTGFIDDAVVYAQRSVNLDRLAWPKAETLAAATIFDGRLHEARRLLDRDAALWPDVTRFVTLRVGMEARTGDPAVALAMMNDSEVRAAFEESPKIDDFRRVALARMVHDRATKTRFVEEMSRQARDPGVLPGRAVLMLASVGAVDAAYAAVARVADGDLGDLLFRTETADMRADPRFMPLAARGGLVAFWRWRRKWPDFCRAPGLPYRCAVAAATL